MRDAVAVLTRTPATLNALLRGMPGIWVSSSEGENTWSAFDIVGHLIVGERTDWMPRVRVIIENGEARTFDLFDRSAQFESSRGRSLEQLLDDFAHLRAENLAALQALNLQAMGEVVSGPRRQKLRQRHRPKCRMRFTWASSNAMATAVDAQATAESWHLQGQARSFNADRHLPHL